MTYWTLDSGISISISIGYPILGYKVADIILAKNFGTTLVKSLPPQIQLGMDLQANGTLHVYNKHLDYLLVFTVGHMVPNKLMVTKVQVHSLRLVAPLSKSIMRPLCKTSPQLCQHDCPNNRLSSLPSIHHVMRKLTHSQCSLAGVIIKMKCTTFAKCSPIDCNSQEYGLSLHFTKPHQC